jgi:hypothetical protein
MALRAVRMGTTRRATVTDGQAFNDARDAAAAPHADAAALRRELTCEYIVRWETAHDACAKRCALSMRTVEGCFATARARRASSSVCRELTPRQLKQITTFVCVRAEWRLVLYVPPPPSLRRLRLSCAFL